MRSLLAVATTLTFAGTLLTQQPAKPDTAPGDTIRGTGCVQAGVESGCTTLKDNKTGEMYTLFFASGKAPAANTGIWFEGAAHQGMTTCMQGSAVDVAKWKRKKLHCSAPSSSGHAS